jgi:small subunit ribosomal protein S22
VRFILEINCQNSLLKHIDFRFLSTEQLEMEIKESIKRAEHLLQMPPICQIKIDEPRILSKDPALTNFDSDNSTFVFTDITYGIKDSDRVVVLRQPDGTLETAPSELRKRVNQIYFPHEGRKIQAPKMFNEPNLQNVLNNFQYEFILDRMCLQFEPYETEFHTISSKVYQHVNEHKRFDDLRSTRHFGPMAFFFAWHKMIDDLLIEMIKRDYLKNGVELIRLMKQLNNLPIDSEESVFKQIESLSSKEQDLIKDQTYQNIGTDDVHVKIEKSVGKSVDDLKIDELCLGLIESYIKRDGLKKAQLEIVVQTFKETHKQQQELLEGLQKAHGLS